MTPLSHLVEADQRTVFQLRIDERMITFLIREDIWEHMHALFSETTPRLITDHTDIAEEYIPVKGSWGFSYFKGERRMGGLSLIEKKATPGWQMIRAHFPSRRDDRPDVRYALMLQLLSRQFMWSDYRNGEPSSVAGTQLVVFNSVLNHQSAAVEAILSPTCVRLLTEASDEQRQAIANEVDRFMLIGRQAMSEFPVDPSNIGAKTVIWIDEGALVVHLPIPFHRGGLDPDLDQRGAGLQLVSHNVDTPLHQISLIAGLAALDQTVRATLVEV